MRNYFNENGNGGRRFERLRLFLLDLDARIDFGLFRSSVQIRENWERFSTFMDRFHVAGFKRAGVEIVSEGATLLVGGLIVMAALAVPAFRMTSDADWLKKSELAVTFLDRYGNELGSRGIKHNDALKLSDFPDALIKAVLATEDRRFYEHFGIDFSGTFRALLTNARAGGVVQGGSSLTQQLAKNLFLSNERTMTRKVNEAFLAVWLETRLSKNQILKLYLDRAYLGGGTYGVDAAAQFYFNKSARDVNLSEAAMLAGLFKAPTKYAPHLNLPAARARANQVLDNLVEAGFMTEGQVFGARRHPASIVDRRDERSPNYYLDYAFEEMRKLVDTFPKSMTERVFVVRTGIDIGLQHAAEDAIEGSLRQSGQTMHVGQAATVVMDTDGAVRAMVGGRDYSESQFNRATDAERQPGSSFKPYVYATALTNGFTPQSVVVDGPVCIGNWCPHNYGGSYRGAVSLLTAITNSINVVPVKLSIMLGHGNAKLGRQMIRETAKAAGIVHTPLPDTPSMPIGADVVTVLDHTGGYTMFPNDGMAATPHTILEVRTSRGEPVWRFDRDGPKKRRVISKSVAEDMNRMMHNVVEAGTATRAQLDGIPVAGKTGTTNDWRDAWFVGFSGNFVCALWMGNDDYTSTNHMTGGTLPAATWQKIMSYAHQGVELKTIPGLSAPTRAQVAAGDSQRVPTLTQRGFAALEHIEHAFDEAAQALPGTDRTATTTDARPTLQSRPTDTIASAATKEQGEIMSGN